MFINEDLGHYQCFEVKTTFSITRQADFCLNINLTRKKGKKKRVW